MKTAARLLKEVCSAALWVLTGGNLFKKRKEAIFPPGDNHSCPHANMYSRREIVKNLASVPLFGFVFWNMFKNNPEWNSFEENNLSAAIGGDADADSVKLKYDVRNKLEGEVPKGTIKGLDISRMIIGGNLVSGFAHSRDLLYASQLVKQYHTDEKVIETLFLCESCGVNAAILRTDDDTVRILDKYRKRGGNIQWIAQYYPSSTNMDNVNLAIDNGAVAAFCQGARADSFVSVNRVDVLHDSMEYIRAQGIPSGVGAHTLNVPVTFEREELNPDFYMKTLHHYNFWSAASEEDRSKIRLNNWSPDTEKTIAFMNQVRKPWIAFKVLAAGAIHPSDGIRYAFEQGADFACVGMFDFQIIENSNIVYNMFQEDIPRARPWMG